VIHNHPFKIIEIELCKALKQAGQQMCTIECRCENGEFHVCTNLVTFTICMKKTILFEVDFKDWAFYFMVKSWSLKLADEYICYYVCNEPYRIKALKKTNQFQIFIWNLISTVRFQLLKVVSCEKRKVQFIH